MTAATNSGGGIDYDAIPEAPKTHDQWVCWRTATREQADGTLKETKLPVEARDDPKESHGLAAADDPETWTTFEAAREYHERADTDTAGIGFVFTAGDMFVGVDLDDVYDPETEEVEPAALDLLDRFDSYAELSPSQTGGHIICMGRMGDTDYNKQPFDRENDALADRFDGDDPDIEMYEEGRFFTVTGDRGGFVADTPATVEPAPDVVESVAGEYLTKDDEDDPAGESTTLDGFNAAQTGASASASPASADLDDDTLVSKAQNAENGDLFADLYRGRWESHYPSQSEADLAFCGMLAFWTQRDESQMDRIFRDSGLMRPKWDESRGSETYGERTVSKAASGVRDVYDPAKGTGIGDSGGHGHGHDRGAAGDGPDHDAIRERVAADPTVESDGENLLLPSARDATAVSVARGDCGYSVRKGDPADPTFDPITNFLLAPNHQLTTPAGDQYVALTVIPRADDPFDVMVEPGVFNEPRDFRAEVCTGVGTRFEGNRRDLGKLRDLLTEADIPRREGARHVGVYGHETETPEFVFPGGTLRAEGWTDDPTHVYVERNVEVERKVTLTPDDRPEADYDREAVAQALDLLPQTRDPERFIPVLGWFYATPFRPFIKAETGEFNHLSVTGETGAGKSSTLGKLAELFGMDAEPLGLRGTKFEITANMSVPSALPLVYDEYKPSELDGYLLDHFHDHLRKSSRGAVEQRGRQDGSTRSYPLDGPVAVAGESAIQGPAERRRSIMTTFRAATTDTGTETAATFNALHDLDVGTDHALAWFRWVLDQLDDPAEVRALWEKCDRRVAEILDAAGYDAAELDPLARQGLQTVVFGVAMFRAFATDMGLDADSAGLRAVNDDERDRAVVALARDLLDGDHRKSHMDQFLEAMSRAAGAGYLEDGDHYKVVKNGTPNALVRVNLSQSYPEVRSFVADHDLGDDVDLLNYDDYRGRFAEAAENALSYVDDFDQPDADLGRTVGIHASMADDAVTDFAPRVFGVDAPKTDDGPGAGGHDDDQLAQDTDDPRKKVLNRLAVLSSKTGDGSIAEAELVRHVVKLDKIPFSKADHLVAKLTKEGHIIDATTDGGEPRVRPRGD